MTDEFSYLVRWSRNAFAQRSNRKEQSINRSIDIPRGLPKELSLGCAGRSYSNQLFAKASARKPPDAFINLAASGAAIIFTLPKDDVLKGVTRCIKRMGLIHGDDVSIRYRRLDMHCVRTKTEASIAISRGTDE